MISIESLYLEMMPQLRAYFVGHLFARDCHMADDFSHDVFARLMKHDGRYTDDGHVRGLVWTIARNILIDHQRRQHPWGRACSLDMAVHDRADPDTARDFDAVTDTFSLADLDITPEQRIALDAKYWRGETWEEASARLGMPVHGLKKLKCRALARLRKRMAA